MHASRNAQPLRRSHPVQKWHRAERRQYLASRGVKINRNPNRRNPT